MTERYRFLLPKKVLLRVSLYILATFVLLFVNMIANVDILGAIIFIWFFVYSFRGNRNYFIKYIRVIIMAIYHLVSVYIVNNSPIYFYNLQQMSADTGSFIPLLLFYLIEFGVLYLLEMNKNSRLINSINTIPINTQSEIEVSKNKKTLVKHASVLILLLVFYMIFRLIGNGYYSMGGIDRFAYRASAFTSLDEKLYNYIIWLLPIPLLAKNIGLEKMAYIFLGFLCFYLLLVGDKFSSLFTVFYIYLLVCWAIKKIDKKMMFRVILLIVIVFVALFIYIGYQVLYERGGGLETVLIYFNNRITGGQSDLWWKIYSTFKNGPTHILEFGDELGAIISQPSNPLDYNFGIYKMMKIAAPWSVVSSYLSRGARFAASTQASVFYYFGSVGLYLFGVISACILFWVVNHAVYAYKKMDMIESVCYTMILQKSFLLLSMSDITVFGHITLWVAVIVLLFHKRIKRSSRYKTV